MVSKKIFHGIHCVAACLGLCISIGSHARGVSPYLPLDLSPDIERKIEQVLILGDKPVMRRPIAAAIVLDALPRACQQNQELCDEVKRYLDTYMHTANVTELRAEAALTSGDSSKPIPNAHGMLVNSHWSIAADAYYQPSDYLLINGGLLGYEGRVTPTGSVVSVGFDFAQLDIGYRDHWFSPNTDSSMLMSTEAPTMPSITLSNYRPLTSLGIGYELFFARMSTQHGIEYFDTTTDGHPNLAGLQLSFEPVDGYALAVNRLMQYGGGARGGANLKQFYKALFDSNSVNRGDAPGNLEFGNQQASVTASAIFIWKVPFSVNVEYAAEDGAHRGLRYFGDTDATLGIDFPQLWSKFDLNYEVSEWQNAWYVHHLYPAGMTNDNFVVGHWFGDERVFNNAIGGHSQSLGVGYNYGAGYLRATYRQMAYDAEWAGPGAQVPYKQFRELGLRYSFSLKGHPMDVEMLTGKDISGESFARLSGSFSLVPVHAGASSTLSDDADVSNNTALLVDIGLNRGQINQILEAYVPRVSTPLKTTPHIGVGVRRRISQCGDLGMRLEFDRLNDQGLISLRVVDYRYRIADKIALAGFLGVGRYDAGLPSYGWYTGLGVQYLSLFKNWDLNFEWYQHYKLGRDKVLASDPPVTSASPRVFFDTKGLRFYLTRSF